jgi:hypothetical protein
MGRNLGLPIQSATSTTTCPIQIVVGKVGMPNNVPCPHEGLTLDVEYLALATPHSSTEIQ